jgi:hypothetical protein
MSRGKREFLLPPPREKGVAAWWRGWQRYAATEGTSRGGQRIL